MFSPNLSLSLSLSLINGEKKEGKDFVHGKVK
jgi:hypothetical protein